MQKINTDFILPFIEATHTTFKMMVHCELRRKEVYIKKNFVMFGDISGIIGFSGAVCGTAAISLPGPFAFKCIENMMGETPEGGLTDRVVNDGVGEIVNLIAGQAKTTLSTTPHRFEITLPTIISGRGHELYHRQGTSIVSIIFETAEGEELAVDVSTRISQDTSSLR